MRDPGRIREFALAAFLPRGAAFSVAVLAHLVILAGFLAQLRIGLPVELHSDAHLSDAETPMIATILWQGSAVHAPLDSTPSILDAQRLVSLSKPIEIPTPTPEWSIDSDPAVSSAQPAPAPGRTGLHCEVHIHQDTAGRVQAIDFGECTGDMVWQHTLLKTIEHAAQLIEPAPDARFPPVRTLIVGTDNLSPIVLAQQLSTTEMFEKQTMLSSEQSQP